MQPLCCIHATHLHCATHLHALSIIFASPVHHTCWSYAAYLQALCSIFASRTIFAGPAVHQSCRPCSIFAGPGPVHHTCRPCSCAAYAHPVQHICSPLCIIFAFTLQALWHQHHTCRLLHVIGGRRTDTGGLHGYLTSLGGVHHICIWET